MNIWRKFLRQKKITGNSNNDILEKDFISSNINKTIGNFKNEFGNSPDLVIREIELGTTNPTKAAAIYIDGLINITTLQKTLSLLLTNETVDLFANPNSSIVKAYLLNATSVKEESDKNQILYYLLNGFTIILIDKSSNALIICTQGGEMRAVSEPTNQIALKGPKEAFVENINVNVALIRRRIGSSKLRLKHFIIGDISKTTIGIMYIEDLADNKIIAELENNLNNIKIDGLLESNYLEEIVADNPWSIFPTVYYSERPDVVSADLFEGRVAVITDGSPFVQIIPITFFKFFQAADDYYQNWSITSFIRLLSFFTFFISLILPSFYVAITTFHQELIPTNLLISLATQREGVPFPAFFEAFFMELIFEILREASLRMPRGVGQAISFIGAIVIGTAAVDAGFVSAAIVIIVSMTAISSFTTPSIELAATARLLRFGLLILSASFGLIGILFGMIIIAIHLCSINPYGTPYFDGLAPFDLNKQKDLLIRLPWSVLKKNNSK